MAKTPFVFRFMGSYRDNHILSEDSMDWLQTSEAEIKEEYANKSLDILSVM